MAIDDRTQSLDRHGKRRDEIDVDGRVTDKAKLIACYMHRGVEEQATGSRRLLFMGCVSRFRTLVFRDETSCIVCGPAVFVAKTIIVI